MTEKPAFAESDTCGVCEFPSADHGVQPTPMGWRQSLGPTHEYRAPTSRQVNARVAIRVQQAEAAERYPELAEESARYIAVASPMAPPPEDPFVTEVEEMLYHILINYEREGSGPGSRFEGKTLERCQAEQLIRHVRWHDQLPKSQEGSRVVAECTHEIIFEPETNSPGELLTCACGAYTATVQEFVTDTKADAEEENQR